MLVALTHAHRYGLGRVRGLALVGGTACPGQECRWFQGETAATIASEAEARARALDLTECADPVAVAGAWLATRDADLRPVLPDITAPTLILHGTDDDQCPLSHGRLLAANIPNARIEALQGGGHQLPSQASTFVAEHLAGLYRGIVT